MASQSKTLAKARSNPKATATMAAKPLVAVPIPMPKAPTQVATVQMAGKMLEAGGRVGPLDRELHISGSTYTHQVVEAGRQTAMLISAGVIRALRHRGLLKDFVLPVEA